MKLKTKMTILALPILTMSFFTTQSLFATPSLTKEDYVKICPNSSSQKQDCKLFSKLVMGTDHLSQSDWQFKGQKQAREEEVFQVLDEAARLGINFFDTSPIYVGGVENQLGRWREKRKDLIKKNSFYQNPDLNPDREIYVLSKGGFPYDLYYSQKLEPGVYSKELITALLENGVITILTPEAYDIDPLTMDYHLKTTIELTQVPTGTYASRLYGNTSSIARRVNVELGHTLKNLNQNITIYLMHRDDGDYIDFEFVPRERTSVETIMSALSQEDVRNKFWRVGWSNWNTDRIQKSLNPNKKMLPHSYVKPIINSPYFSLFEMTERTIHAGGVQVTHKDMMDLNFQIGIKIMPYSPLGGFSILDKPEPKWENAKATAKELHLKGDAYWKNVYPAIFENPENQARYARAVQFTQKWNEKHKTSYTLDQMLNAYVLAHPRVDLLAVGPITVEQVRRTVASVQLAKQLSDKDLEYLYRGERK